MRIAFFTDTYYPSVDGVVRSVDAFRGHLQKRGHEVKVFAPEPKEKEFREDGVCYAPSLEFWAYPQYRIPYSSKKIIKECEKFKPDIVHSHAMVLMGGYAKRAAKKCGCPLVGTFHTLLPDAGHYVSDVEGIRLWFRDLCWRYLKRMYKDFDMVVSPSKFMQKKIGEHGIRSEFVVPTPVDVERFCPAKPNPGVERWNEDNKKTILFFGRVAKEKNIDFLLKVANSPRFGELGAKILVAGEGPYKKEFQKKVFKAGADEKILFAGKVDEGEVASYYRVAECALFPSRFETQGLTAIESLACGTPVVCFEKTALAEIVDSKCGAVISEDLNIAIKAIKRVLQNSEKMQGDARKKGMEYSIEKCGKKLEGAYKKALKK